MSATCINLPFIAESEKTPLVEVLLGIIATQQEQITRQQEQIQELKNEIARLKGHKEKPKIKPSRLERGKKKSPNGGRGTNKRSKLKAIEIHETKVIAPKEKPEGSRFKGYADFTVVGLKFAPHNIRYRLEVWRTPNGERVTGELPAALRVEGGHYSPELATYIRHQYHHCLVPQGLVWEQLREIEVPISEGQVNRILLDNSAPFHDEKDDLLKAGLEVSTSIHTDDTGARHKGKNGYCTYIGNEWFAYFASTESKSRINFLKIMRAGRSDYVLGPDALAYMTEQKLPKEILKRLEAIGEMTAADDNEWREALRNWGVTKKRHQRIITEGALVGSVLAHGIRSNLAIVSDDAGQFNVLLHALCWVHAERLLAKLVGFSEEQRQALESTRSAVWDFYRSLKAYKVAPEQHDKEKLSARFDKIFTTQTCFASLNEALKRLHKNKKELLFVLERPDVALHNNIAENDIRDYVMRRKRCGSTRSDLGRRCRDTFASLKKTCRKLGISFWKYLLDRSSGSNTVAYLPDLVRQRASEATARAT